MLSTWNEPGLEMGFRHFGCSCGEFLHIPGRDHGTQEGVLAYYTYSQADGAISGMVMLKVLISA